MERVLVYTLEVTTLEDRMAFMMIIKGGSSVWFMLAALLFLSSSTDRFLNGSRSDPPLSIALLLTGDYCQTAQVSTGITRHDVDTWVGAQKRPGLLEGVSRKPRPSLSKDVCVESPVCGVIKPQHLNSFCVPKRDIVLWET